MRVAINCQILTVNRLGVGRYLKTLLQALSATDSENEYVLLANSRIRDLLPQRPNFEVVATSFPIRGTRSRILWEQVFLPMELRRQRADVVHFPDQSLPLLSLLPCPSVVTVHDLTTYRYTEAYTRGKVLYKKFATRAAMRQATRIIAVSQSTRQDILELFGVSENQVRAVYSGLDRRFRPVEDCSRLERRRTALGLPEQYILHVGSIDPRKNLVTMFKALAILRDDGLQVKLVVAGSKEYNYRPIFDAVQALGLEDQVLFLGFVSDAELVDVYNLAQLFVFPSIHEGFGYPPLEAMACGTPVVVSNSSALPEIVGDAALQVNPLNAAELAAAIRLLLTDSGLREQLAFRGKQRAAFFTWERTARETLKVYEEVVEGVRPKSADRR
jgi:glycosyltransferase involved in cell wall biosynthesis